MLVREAAIAFVADPENNFAPSTRAGYRERLERIVSITKNDDIRGVKEDDLIFAINLGGHGTYRNSLISTFKSFFGWALMRGHIDVDPSVNLSRRVKTDTRPVKQNTWMSMSEVRQFLQWLPTATTRERRDQLLFHLGFTTGLRRAELQALTFNKMDVSKGKAFIKGKGGKLAEVYLQPEVRNLLYNWGHELAEIDERVVTSDETDRQVYVLPPLREIWTVESDRTHIVLPGPISLRQISDIVRNTSLDYGAAFATHDMRRSFAGIVQEELGDIRKTSQALRHSNIGTTQRYLETRQDAAYLVGQEINF